MALLLLGKSGYIGSALLREIESRKIPHVALSLKEVEYTDEQTFRETVAVRGPTHVINAAAWIPQPSVDACRYAVIETWKSNVQFPVMLATVCKEMGVTLCHISTGCLYDEQRYYTEEDAPTRLNHDYAGVYVTSKYCGELLVRKLCPDSYVWRIRLPFDETDHPRNFLTKIQQHPQIWDHTNSLTHRGDFAKAAIDMIEKSDERGVYNMTNPMAISTRSVLSNIQNGGILPKKKFVFVPGPVPGTLLATDKLEATGICMRPGAAAVADALNNWRKP